MTDTTYRTCEELKNIEEADLYLAGSDQIWNPIFPNGKDPAFFLQFTEKGRRASYAASFAVDELKEEVDRQRMKKWLKSFDAVSVREQNRSCIW
ncbi:MAG: polysaccharide pyruvyl transferase family protein [Fusicatenibacter saccharivorans]